MPKLTPPYIPQLRTLDIYRGVREVDLTLCYPNGDTYLVTLDEARCLLRCWKLLPHVIDRILDRVWNTYAIRVDLRSGYNYSIEPLPEDTSYLVGPLDQYTWVLGTNELF
jgi:hypothetical protein